MRADELLNGARRSRTFRRVFVAALERDRGTVIPTASISGGKGVDPRGHRRRVEASGCVAGLQASTCCGRERSRGVRPAAWSVVDLIRNPCAETRATSRRQG